MHNASNFEVMQSIKGLPKTNPVAVGDIFVEQWGATMLMVNFYQVVATKGKSTIVLHEIHSKDESTGFLSGTLTPIKDDFRTLDHNTKLITCRITKGFDGGLRAKVRAWGSYAQPIEAGRSYSFDHCD